MTPAPIYSLEVNGRVAARGLGEELAGKRIGPANLLWGTDHLGLLGRLTYTQPLRLRRLRADFLSARGRAMFLGDNAARVYGLPRAPASTPKENS